MIQIGKAEARGISDGVYERTDENNNTCENGVTYLKLLLNRESMEEVYI